MFSGSVSCVPGCVSVTEKRLRKPFAAVVAGGWLGIVGLLTFVFPASNRYTGRVVAISESAQVIVLRDGRPRSLRLAEVDFPEKGQLRAREARALANRLALGRDVNVEEARLPGGRRGGARRTPAAPTGKVSRSRDVEPSSADTDAAEVEGSPLAETPAADEAAGAALGEN